MCEPSARETGRSSFASKPLPERRLLSGVSWSRPRNAGEIARMYYELTDHFVVASDLGKTWEFFGAAENLPRITPPSLAFRILTPRPIVIGQDSLLDYTIRWAGVPIHWRTRIIDWTPERQFIDMQLRGPYTLWHHQHMFTPSEEGTICTDRVVYKVPGGPLGSVLNALVIRRQLLGIFRFRRRAIAGALGWVRAVQEDVVIRRL